MTHPYKAAAFDLGGPGVRTPFEMTHVFERNVGLPEGSLTWRGPFDPSTDELWRKMQDGVITEREYWHARAVELEPYTGSTQIKDFFKLAFDGTEEEVMRTEANELRLACTAAGIVTAILTNDYQDFNEPGWGAEFAFIRDIDVFMDGSVTGLLKPDPRAYQLLADTLGFAPEEILFMDDQPWSIEGAASIGMATEWIDVRDPAPCFRRAADRLGVTVNF